MTMADTTRAQVLTYLENANMMEISDLISDIEEKFGVTAAATYNRLFPSNTLFLI